MTIKAASGAILLSIAVGAAVAGTLARDESRQTLGYVATVRDNVGTRVVVFDGEAVNGKVTGTFVGVDEPLRIVSGRVEADGSVFGKIVRDDGTVSGSFWGVATGSGLQGSFSVGGASGSWEAYSTIPMPEVSQ